MSEKKKFLLRVDAGVFSALEKWAADDLRSVNAQIEFLLTDAVRRAGRKKPETEIQKGVDSPTPASTSQEETQHEPV